MSYAGWLSLEQAHNPAVVPVHLLKPEIAQIHIVGSDLTEHSNRLGADLLRAQAGREILGESGRGHRKEVPQLGQRGWIGAPIEKHSEDARERDPPATRFHQEPLEGA